MPIQNYGVLAGRVFARVLATKKDEHYHMLLNRGAGPQRAAINTQSTTPPSQVLYYSAPNFQHPITSAILGASLPMGYTPLTSASGGLALDFVRMGLFPLNAMKPLSASARQVRRMSSLTPKTSWSTITAGALSAAGLAR